MSYAKSRVVSFTLFDQLTPRLMMNEQVSKKIDTRVRDKDFVRKPGKTRMDRASGAHQRNASNKSQRAAWGNRGSSPATFPWETCNGKRTQAMLKRRTSKRG